MSPIVDIIREGTGERKTPSAAMKKTLFIGLGGSGREVLMRLRRKFYASSENKYGFDFIRYLWVDTDVDGPGIADENWEIIGENISFGFRDGINEICDASVDRETLSSFYDRINTYPHIQYWFPAKEIKPLGYEALLNGAKGIRPLGRLAFSWHSDYILSVLQQNITMLDRQFNIPGIDLDNNIDIYVICSLAGGTGSGMFLELAKLLKSNWPTYSVYGIFFLSDMFSLLGGDNEYRDANCYAALQELDFYQTASNSLDPLISVEHHMFEFVNSEGKAKKFNLPLYSNVFLITNEYYKMPQENYIYDPFDMVAEIFYYDFDKSSFGIYKRSNTVNTKITGSQASIKYSIKDPETNQNIGVEDTYHSDYSSFALSGIFLNVSKMKTWASYKYLVSLLENLITDNQENNQLYENPDGSFRLNKLEFEQIKNMITNGNKSTSVYEEYIQNINSRKDKKLVEIETKISFDHSNISSIQQKCKDILINIDSFIQEEEGKINSEFIYYKGTPGPSLEKLESNFNISLTNLYMDIEQLMYEILANYKIGGIRVANQMLERIRAIINQMDTIYNNFTNDLKRKKDSKKQERPEHPIIQVDSKIEVLLHKIQDCNEIPWFFPGYKRKAKTYYDRILSYEINNMNREIQHQLTEYLTNNLNIIKQNYEILYYEKVAELVQKFMQKILEIIDASDCHIPNIINSLGMNKQIQEYQKNINSFLTYFNHYECSMRNEISRSLNRKIILDEDVNINDLYKKFVENWLKGDDWFVSKIADSYKEYINKVHTVDNMNNNMQIFVCIMSLYDIISNGIERDIKIDMRDISHSEFNNFMEENNVTNQLLSKLRRDENHCRHSIRQMLENFYVRIALSQTFTNIKTRIEGSSMVRIIGLPEKNDKIENLLRELGNIENIQYHGSKESILFYSETFGYPLFMLKNIGQLKEKFNQNLQQGANNKIYRYTDIVTDYLKPLVLPASEEEMVSLLHCWEVLYEAIVLRIINYQDKNWVADIINPQRFNIEEKITFGRTLETTALTLNNNRRILDTIRTLVNNTFFDKYKNIDSIEQIWFALFDNYRDIDKFINYQYQDNMPKIPQEYAIEKLLDKYLNRYAKFKEISTKEAQDILSKKFDSVLRISSGYSDAMHTNGLKIYPQ